MPARRPIALLALLALSACAPAAARTPRDEKDDGSTTRTALDLDSARELDQSGVRAFKEGRFADAIRFFRAAYRKGAPASELWNVARCDERLDDAERAAAAIQEYLAQRDLPAADRADAERELRALASRTSMLTVTTVPPGAVVVVDGKQVAGPTPLTLDVAAGSHSLTIRRDGYTPETRPFEARYGRAVIVSLDLARANK
jgi:hypothetical protein